MITSSDIVDSELIRLWPLAYTGALRGVQSSTCKQIRKMFQNLFKNYVTMLQFVRLHPSVVYILISLNSDPKPVLGLQEGFKVQQSNI